MKRKTKIKIFFLIITGILTLGFFMPQSFVMPVEGATQKDYNHETFWYYPWGKSVTHKGVDIFAKEGTALRSATCGLVVFTGENGAGGNVVLVLGPKWRFHYYAHLQHIETSSFSWLGTGERIGTVGKSGNAGNTPAHLHYSIITAIPYVWRVDRKAPHGWRKIFFLNPVDYLKQVR
ncbi:MAG: M23 family metallopeptidase [Tannerella sp.]|jgi:murein DD-endopeptidase MepM/ murein hydrolase activator NlpD|nr:M23 family metallopeptidase [Tannerella sp.]